jgi:hypothetical protein
LAAVGKPFNNMAGREAEKGNVFEFASDAKLTHASMVKPEFKDVFRAVVDCA